MTDHRTDDNAAENSAETSDTGAESPTGGDQSTEDRLTADNEVEEDMLKSLDPDAAPA